MCTLKTFYHDRVWDNHVIMEWCVLLERSDFQFTLIGHAVLALNLQMRQSMLKMSHIFALQTWQHVSYYMYLLNEHYPCAVICAQLSSRWCIISWLHVSQYTTCSCDLVDLECNTIYSMCNPQTTNTNTHIQLSQECTCGSPSLIHKKSTESLGNNYCSTR